MQRSQRASPRLFDLCNQIIDKFLEGRYNDNRILDKFGLVPRADLTNPSLSLSRAKKYIKIFIYAKFIFLASSLGYFGQLEL